MTTDLRPLLTDPPSSGAPDLSRRTFLRGAALAGGGLVAVTLAACAPTAAPGWAAPLATAPGLGAATPPAAASASPAAPSAAASPTMSHAVPSATAAASGSPAPSVSLPPGWASHDVAAQENVARFLAGEWQSLPGYGNQPLEPRVEGDVRVFDLTIDQIQHRIDARKDPLEALGYNGMWPGPQLRVTEGETVRAIFTNNLPETTGVHFHGQDVPNAMDGVPLVTQDPIVPGGTFTYEFVAKPSGSHMYHSHHNATDQVGRGLLGAFIVEPKDPAERYVNKYGVTQDIVWISNDQLGGFTINGRGFPATAPIVAKLGERIAIRFMNEGVMMHPWHLHGMPMRVVTRDGYPLGGAEFRCDTLGVNPGERWDVIIDCNNPGVWAFHCHILTHAEGQEGMFGMVTALVVEA